MLTHYEEIVIVKGTEDVTIKIAVQVTKFGRLWKP